MWKVWNKLKALPSKTDPSQRSDIAGSAGASIEDSDEDREFNIETPVKAPSIEQAFIDHFAALSITPEAYPVTMPHIYHALRAADLQRKSEGDVEGLSRKEINKMAYEIHSHAFLSIHTLIETIHSYQRGSFKTEGGTLLVHTAILDACVAVEKLLDLHEYKTTGQHSRVHDFSKQIDIASSPTAKRFLKESDKGTLPVRFPHLYSTSIPLLLKPVYDENTGAKDKINASVQLVNIMLEIFGNSIDPKKQGLLNELTLKINHISGKFDPEQQVVQKQPKKKQRVLAQFINVDQEIEALKQVTTDARWRTKAVVAQIEFYTNLLKDVELYADTHRGPEHEFQKVRNLFIMEKTYEELLVFLFNLSRKQVEPIEDIHNLSEIMDKIELSGIKLDPNIKSHIQNINIGNNTHYLFNRYKGERESVLAKFFKHTTQELLNDKEFKTKDQMLKSKAAPQDIAQEIALLNRSYRELLDFLPHMISTINEQFKKER